MTAAFFFEWTLWESMEKKETDQLTIGCLFCIVFSDLLLLQVFQDWYRNPRPNFVDEALKINQSYAFLIAVKFAGCV